MSNNGTNDKLVLVIDDDEDIRDLIGDTLEEAGFEVVFACNGNQGLEKFEAARPSVVVTDLLMPDKEGIETIFELMRTYKFTNILAMSGGGRSKRGEFLEIAKKLGVAKVRQKPIDLDDLVADVTELAGLKAAPAV